MATHSSIHVWRIPWTEEPGRLQFMGSQSQAHQEEETDGLFRMPVKLLLLFQDFCLIILLSISISPYWLYYYCHTTISYKQSFSVLVPSIRVFIVMSVVSNDIVENS